MPTDWDVVRTMERFGGSFAVALAGACHRADPENLARIKAAFPELWTKYADMSVMAAKRDERIAEGDRVFGLGSDEDAAAR